MHVQYKVIFKTTLYKHCVDTRRFLEIVASVQFIEQCSQGYLLPGCHMLLANHVSCVFCERILFLVTVVVCRWMFATCSLHVCSLICLLYLLCVASMDVRHMFVACVVVILFAVPSLRCKHVKRSYFYLRFLAY